MALTLQAVAATRKQSLQSQVPIDFSGITCIGKGLQDMTRCPISSKTKHTWMSVPLSSEGCSLPFCYIFILWIYSHIFILRIFLFLANRASSLCEEHQSSFHLVSFFFTASSNVILSAELMLALTALSSFVSVFYDENKPTNFGLGTISHCIL